MRFFRGSSLRVARGFITASAVLALLAAPHALRAQDSDLAVGSAVPAATVIDLNGHSVRLAATAGRPMLIEFWATWCEFCERLEPTMKDVYSRYGSRVQFSAVAVNVNESRTRVARHVAERSLGYPVFYDESGEATRVFDVPTTSFVVIVDRKGKVTYTGTGDKQDLDAALRRVL